MSISNYAKTRLERIFARQTRKIIVKHKPKIVAVVGSVGKTTTKAAIITVLEQGLRVQSQAGNYNTPITVPLIFIGRNLPTLSNPFAWFGTWLHGQKVLHGEYLYDVVVVELAVDAPGDLAVFKDIFHPDISVITAVSEEHMEFFKTLDVVAAEELSISKFSKTLVVNTDDINEIYLEKYLTNTTVIHSYGFDHTEYKIVASPNKQNGFAAQISLGGGQIIECENVQTVAKHNLKAMAAAVAVADLLGVNPQAIKQGVCKVQPFAGRMQLLKGIKNSLIIDDTYNSSPLAAEAALQTLYDMPANQRIAILGKMNELGTYSKEAHQRVGRYCDPTFVELFVTIGDDANSFLALTAESKGCKVLRTNNPYEAAKIVAENLHEGGVVLAKGSQNGVFAEEAVKMLLADPNDASKLVRQNKFWQAKKHAQFPQQ